MGRIVRGVAVAATVAAVLGMGASAASATAEEAAHAQSDLAAQDGCWVESDAGRTFTEAWGSECVGVQARIDRIYQGKLISVNGKWGTFSLASSSLGTFVGNYVRANNDGTITTWVTVPWSGARASIPVG